MQGQGKSKLRGLGEAVHGTHTGLRVLPGNTHNSQHMGGGTQRVLCQQEQIISSRLKLPCFNLTNPKAKPKEST